MNKTHHKKPSRVMVALVAVRNFCTIAKAGITDVIAIAAFFGVCVNLAWCMVHGKEIEQLREKVKAQEAQIQQHKTPAFTPQQVARKFNFFLNQRKGATQNGTTLILGSLRD